MTSRYKFTYRRRKSLWPFWRTHVVIGHRIDEVTHKLCLYYEDGSVREVSSWENCECRLGIDWVHAQKKAMEAQAGMSIPLAVDQN